MKTKKKKISKISKKEECIHYCKKCRKRTPHKGEGIKWVKYQERCTICGTANYTEYQRQSEISSLVLSEMEEDLNDE